MTLQVKETGTPVNFTQAMEIKLQEYTFQDDIFGIYAYQSAPITVDAATRDIFFNGNLADLQNQAIGQGIPIQYIRITWNETQQGSNYYITDLAVGVVSKATRNFNTGPAYLIGALRAIGWFYQLEQKVNMPWKAWKLVNPKRTDTNYHHWAEISVSKLFSVSAPMDQALPDLPDVATVKAEILSQEAVQNALGVATTKLLDKGYSVTYLPNGYGIDICFEKGPTMRPPGGYVWGYQYRVHVRFWWDFTTDPAFTVVDGASLEPFTLTAAFIFWVIVAVGVAFAIGAVAYNLTHQSSEYEEWDVVRNADGSVWINPDTGLPEPLLKKKGKDEGPPEWWGGLIQNVAIVAVIIGGLIAAVVVIPRLIPKRKEKKK